MTQWSQHVPTVWHIECSVWPLRYLGICFWAWCVQAVFHFPSKCFTVINGNNWKTRPIECIQSAESSFCPTWPGFSSLPSSASPCQCGTHPSRGFLSFCKHVCTWSQNIQWAYSSTGSKYWLIWNVKIGFQKNGFFSPRRNFSWAVDSFWPCAILRVNIKTSHE